MEQIKPFTDYENERYAGERAFNQYAFLYDELYDCMAYGSLSEREFLSIIENFYDYPVGYLKNIINNTKKS